MIKTIIKRNGEREPFNPTKLNGWGIWAAKSLGSAVNWQEALLGALSGLSEEVTSQQLQEALINYCLSRNTWEYNRMAGRLYAALLPKLFYGMKEHPPVQALHQSLQEVGLMVKLDYTDAEYRQVERMIDHNLDMKCAHYEIHQLRFKYALRDKINNVEYETPQFIYMRMAMALAEKLDKTTRMTHVAKWYEHLSHKRINAPTPYMTNLGTGHDGYASCCVYTTDDTAPSLAAGDHIAYMMTVMSAGIGAHIKTRSLGDPIRGGLIVHQGKIPYYKAMIGAIGANLQNGRGGAATMHYTAFDPEAEVIHKLKNPMTPAAKQVRGCDYSFGSNKLFARKVARNENFAPFSYYTNPDLYEAQYKDDNSFEQLYAKHIEKVPETVSARSLLVSVMNEGFETGRHYLTFLDTLNHHTPYYDPIYSSNLCQEIALPTKPYTDVSQLYQPYYEGSGEIATCNIAGIIVSNIESDEQYAEVAYYTLLMIDRGIHMSQYVFKNLEDTAKARMNAGVGILGLAHLMAKEGQRYSTLEGRNFIHELSETHAWHLYNASLKLGQEYGNAPWMHKTKWPKGWLPIDTYEKRVDTFVSVGNKRDWENLRGRIVANGGIRNSVCIAYMPGESSTIAAGTTNGPYPIRDFDLLKGNDTLVVNYVAPDSTKLRDKYEIAWDVPIPEMIMCYGVMQKWTDQGISADLYSRLQGAAKVSSSEMVDTYLSLVRAGLKSRYYHNSLTGKGLELNKAEELDEQLMLEDAAECEACSL